MKTRFATILVVEDDPDDRTFIALAFRRLALSSPLQFVEDGQKAIRYLRGDGEYADRTKFPYPTFIMTDLKMPTLDGFGLLEFLKSNPCWAVIPIVVFSASEDLDDIRTAYLLGASSYHVKPHLLEHFDSQLKVLHDYWLTRHVPQVDVTGKQIITNNSGKLGARFKQPTTSDIRPGGDHYKMSS
jgi:CheY-like chemotaxis protein